MPILHILDVPFRCVVLYCASCGSAQSAPFTSLQLGTERDPNLIKVPACDTCGAQEILNRTFDVAPDSVAEHRKKVNALAVALKAANRVHPNQFEFFRAEKRAPAQVGDLVGPVSQISGLPKVRAPEGLKLPS